VRSQTPHEIRIENEQRNGYMEKLKRGLEDFPFGVFRQVESRNRAIETIENLNRTISLEERRAKRLEKLT